MSLELKPCPHCGGGDVRLCRISRRPYCGECQHWARVNFTGTLEDSVAEWNRRSDAVWNMARDKDDQIAKVRYEIEELTTQFVQLATAMLAVGERIQSLTAAAERTNELLD